MRDDEEGDLLLGELLERSFGAGPDGLPPPADRLAAGRRALRRRRRLTVAVTSTALVAAVGVGVAVSGPGADRGADGPPPPVASDGAVPSADPAPLLHTRDLEQTLTRLSRKVQREQQRLVSDEFPAAYDADGHVVVKEGWRITQRVEEPMGLRPPEASLGVVATDGEHTRWLLLMHEHAEDEQGHPLRNAFGDSASADDPGKGYSRFEDWLASMVELQGGAGTPPLVTVGADDALSPGPGATVVESRPAPVIDGYTTDGDRMAEVRRDGRTWFVVVRGHGPHADVIPVDAAVLTAPTFEALVDHVASQAASGEGLR